MTADTVIHVAMCILMAPVLTILFGVWFFMLGAGLYSTYEEVMRRDWVGVFTYALLSTFPIAGILFWGALWWSILTQ
jgi:hypothetical protein